MERFRRAVWNGWTLTPRVKVWAIACVAGLGLLWQYASSAKPQALPQYGQVPAFVLTDQEGQQVSQAALLGHVWIADFIFTRCAGQCPLMSAQMARLAQAFQEEPSVTFVSFTVDPSYDTPEVLARYASAYAAKPAQWRFLTGDLQTITRLSQAGFQLALSQDGTAQEPITHSRRLVLIDRQGMVRGYYDAGEADAMARVRRDAQRVLREFAS